MHKNCWIQKEDKQAKRVVNENADTVWGHIQLSSGNNKLDSDKKLRQGLQVEYHIENFRWSEIRV